MTCTCDRAIGCTPVMTPISDNTSIADRVTTSVNSLVARDGLRSLTVRSMASAASMTAPALLSYWGTRDRVIAAAVRITAFRRTEWIRQNVSRGPVAFLPEYWQIEDTGAWVAWVEYARTDVEAQRVVDDARREHEHLLHRSVDRELDRDGTTAALSLIDGLVARMCHQGHPLAIEKAEEIVERQVALMLSAASARSAATMASGSSAE